MEALVQVDLDNLSKLNKIDKVDASFIFPNKKEEDKVTGILIFRDTNNHPFLIYIDKMDNEISISEVQQEIAWFLNERLVPCRTFEYSNKIEIGEDKVIFTLIDLDPPKSMTKEEIEKKLGYKINIIT